VCWAINVPGGASPECLATVRNAAIGPGGCGNTNGATTSRTARASCPAAPEDTNQGAVRAAASSGQQSGALKPGPFSQQSCAFFTIGQSPWGHSETLLNPSATTNRSDARRRITTRPT